MRYISSTHLERVPRKVIARRRREAFESYHKYLAWSRILQQPNWHANGKLVCAYCQVPMGYQHSTIDHMHPLALGGDNRPANLVPACTDCNRYKGDAMPLEFFWMREKFNYGKRA